MPKANTVLTKVISAAVFILLEIAALVMVSRSGSLQSAGVARLSHRFAALAWGGSERMRDYFSLQQRNRELADEVFTLEQALDAYRERERHARADSIAAGYAGSRDFEFLPADIVKLSRNKQHNYLILNKGYEDGVQPQSGVITPRGVVGIVTVVERYYSYATAFQNTDFSVSARIGNEGAVGPLRWDGRSRRGALLSEIPLQARFAPGDTVRTSGFSAVFPPDIPLGVLGESRIVNGAMYEIEVELFEDYASVKYVTVAGNTGREEILALENLAEE